MPGFLVHIGATVQCTHGGTAMPVAPYARVTVSGQPVITQTTVFIVAGCALPPPPGANGPCIMGQFMTGSTRVLGGGLPLILIDSQAVCAPTGTPLLIASTQTRVMAT